MIAEGQRGAAQAMMAVMCDENGRQRGCARGRIAAQHVRLTKLASHWRRILMGRHVLLVQLSTLHSVFVQHPVNDWLKN